MSELRLVGLHEDGEYVVLEGADGQRFRLPIDDALRAAVRRDRPQLEQVRAEQSGVLPPREIQARIRAGATAEEVAEESGMPLSSVRRYEGPVLAEREFVAGQAQGTRIGHDPGAPVLGDLVTDRLATRGVAGSSIRWDAFRGAGGGPWTVEVTFEAAGTARSARWTFEPPTRILRAIDDEARWLSETELAEGPIPRRHLAAVPGEVYDVEVDEALRPLLASVDQPASAPQTPEPDPTHALLDDLSGRRGVRQPVDEDVDDEPDGDEFEGFGPQHAFDFDHPGATLPGSVPAAHPPASRPDLATDATVLELPASARRRPGGADAGDPVEGSASAEGAGTTPAGPPASAAPDADADDAREDADEAAPVPEDVPPPLARRARRGRASVPSWDEIVFGAKPE